MFIVSIARERRMLLTVIGIIALFKGFDWCGTITENQKTDRREDVKMLLASVK